MTTKMKNRNYKKKLKKKPNGKKWLLDLKGLSVGMAIAMTFVHTNTISYLVNENETRLFTAHRIDRRE